MRLIDADKIQWEYKCLAKEEIDEQPTIEAIPIEWLEDQIRAIPRDKVYLMQPKNVIENLIIQWQWEQETENENNKR